MEPVMSKSKIEHYNLRWNNFMSNLIQVVSEHQCEEKLVDVTLVCEGQYIKAHKLVLSACSAFFQDMFRSYCNVTHPFIILNGIKFCHMKHIIDFIYQGEIKVSDFDLEGVLALGENLQVKGLSSVKLKEKISTASDTKIKETIQANSIATTRIQDNYSSIENQSPIQKRKALVKSPSSPKLSNDNSTDLVTNYSINEREESEKKRPRLLTVTKNRPIVDNKNTESKDDPNNTECSSGNMDGRQQFHAVSENSTKLEEKIPRPANAFMIFADEWRKKLTIENPGDDNKTISVKLGNKWKSLDSESRELYYAAARRLQIQHQTIYPGYVYIPSLLRKKDSTKSLQDSGDST